MWTAKVNPHAMNGAGGTLAATTAITDAGMVELRFGIDGSALHFAELGLDTAMARHVASLLFRAADNADKIAR